MSLHADDQLLEHIVVRRHIGDHDHAPDDDTTNTSSVLLAKSITMVVLCSVSIIMGLMPMQLAKCLKWDANDEIGNPRSKTVVKLLLGFGGGVLFCTTFLHLLPEVTENVERLVHAGQLPELSFSLAQTLSCAGFFLMYLVEELVRSHLKSKQNKRTLACQKDVNKSTNELVEGGGSVISIPNRHIHSGHGHSHLPLMTEDGDDLEISSLRGLLIVLGLSVHELFEGLAIGLESSSNYVWYMFAAVAAHKFVIAFCIGVELIASRTRRFLAIIYICTFAVVSPLGIGIGMGLVGGGSAAGSGALAVVLQGIASGTLLYVVFFEILHEHRSGLDQYLSILIGFGVMFGLQLASEYYLGLLTSLLLCFGGGVLLFTTFLHLAPEVRESVERHQANGQLATLGTLSLAELLFCSGFFFVYLVEEAVHAALRGKHDASEALLYRTVSVRRCNDRSSSGSTTTTVTSTSRGSWSEGKHKTDQTEPENPKNERSGLPAIFVLSAPTARLSDEVDAESNYRPKSMESSAKSSVTIEKNGSVRGLLTVIALSFHAIFEGLAVGLEPSMNSVLYLAAAIATHKLVIAFCVGMELYVTGASSKTIFGYMSVFSMVTPIGIGVGLALGHFKNDSENLGPTPTILLGMAAGTLLYVVFFEVLARERANEKSGLLQLAAILLGFMLMLGLQIATAHSHSHGGHAEHEADHEHAKGHIHDHEEQTTILSGAIDGLTESLVDAVSNSFTTKYETTSHPTHTH